MLRIKTKLILGLGFLFSVILLLVALGTFYLNRLSSDSTAILKDNYETLEYVQEMTQALDSDLEQFISVFGRNLELQEKNITEIGERELTEKLRNQFDKVVARNKSDSLSVKGMRSLLYDLGKINMQAIVRKNETARHTSGNAVIYIGVVGSLCVLITFTFIVNFPGYIANPIRELTESIKEIANKNYDERLNFKSGDEFGELADAFNSMAEKLDEYESSHLAKIIFEKKRIEAIINKMADPIIGLDEKKKILFANAEAIRILGISEPDLLGKYAPDVALKNDLLRHLIKDLTENDKGDKVDKPLKIFIDKKESFFTKDVLKVTNIPTGEKRALLIGYVVILKDITPFKELDLAKTNFIATISHELKTPLASIQMCMQLLEDKRVGDLNKEQREMLNTVKEETQRLVSITGELLDLTQVETGNITLQLQVIKPREIIDYAVKALKFQAEQKHLEISVVYDEDLPPVKADLDKTAWVMVNLLSNAIRYSPDHGKVILTASKGPNGKVVFSVQDFGKGIDANFTDRIFDRFFKVPGSDPSASGTGLGLAISKDFIASEGGKIWVESELGTGSKFSFELNAAAASASPI